MQLIDKLRYVDVCVWVYVCICVCICVYTCVYVCIHVCMHVCMCFSFLHEAMTLYRYVIQNLQVHSISTNNSSNNSA